MNAPVGPTGPTGATGPAAARTIIPFASTNAPLTTSVAGVPTRVSLIGYGYGDRRGDTSAIDYYSFAISSSDGSFDLGQSGNENHQLVFSLPFDVTLNSLYITVGVWGEIPNPGVTIYPYVQLYAAAANSNTFQRIENALAIPAQAMGPGTVQANTMRSASVSNLDIPLAAGTRLAIGGLMRTVNDTATRNYYIYFTGGIGMTVMD